MDNVTLIRVVSGILAVVVLFILIYRMKKKVPKYEGSLTTSTTPHLPDSNPVGCGTDFTEENPE